MPDEPAQDRAPTFVAENIDKIAQVENEALRPRSHREAITEAIGGFTGTIYFVVLQLVVFGGWILLNAGVVPALIPFRSFPLSVAIVHHLPGGGSVGGVRADQAKSYEHGRRSPRSPRSTG